jgi:hypothetical protein
MRPGRPFYCALLLNSELSSNLNCFWPPPWGLEPDQPWNSFLTWKTLLDSIFSNPCTRHGHKHGCHVRSLGPKNFLAGFKISAHARPVRFVGGPGAGRAWTGPGSKCLGIAGPTRGSLAPGAPPRLSCWATFSASGLHFLTA